MKKLAEQKNIIIYCAGSRGEKVYTQLITLGAGVLCFCDNGVTGDGNKRMGLETYNYETCQRLFPDAVYVVAHFYYWCELEIGKSLEDNGYVKGETYFLASELEAEGILCETYRGLVKILSEQKVLLLVGEENEFAELFMEWSSRAIPETEVYCVKEDDIPVMKERYQDALWLVLCEIVPKIADRKARFLKIFDQYNIKSFSTYFCNYFDYLEADRVQNVNLEELSVGRECIYIAPRSGEGIVLLGSVLDGHPDLLFLGDPDRPWKIYLYYIVRYVKNYKGDMKISDVIIKYIEYFGWNENLSIETFRKILGVYFKEDKKYTEQEIFINIHFAYHELIYGKCDRMGKPRIVLELHIVKEFRETILLWLRNAGFEVALIEMVRRPSSVFGSLVTPSYVEISGMEVFINWLYDTVFRAGVKNFSIEEKKLKKVRMRFEDLKLHPEEMTHKLCDALNIKWDDSLLTTTYAYGRPDKGKIVPISGWGIKSVYYPYDESLDAFDKFRLDMVFHNISKQYGYSYVEESKIPFSMEEIKQLFLLPFKFEDAMFFSSEKEEEIYKRRFRGMCLALLGMQAHVEKYKEWFQFGEYLKAEDIG